MIQAVLAVCTADLFLKRHVAEQHRLPCSSCIDTPTPAQLPLPINLYTTHKDVASCVQGNTPPLPDTFLSGGADVTHVGAGEDALWDVFH